MGDILWTTSPHETATPRRPSAARMAQGTTPHKRNATKENTYMLHAARVREDRMPHIKKAHQKKAGRRQSATHPTSKRQRHGRETPHPEFTGVVTLILGRGGPHATQQTMPDVNYPRHGMGLETTPKEQPPH